MAEYARHRGVSRNAVWAAKQAGRIKLVNGRVDVEQADRDWPLNTSQSSPRNSISGDPQPGTGTGPRSPHERDANGSANGHGPAAGTYSAHRGRREAALAEMAEMELAQRRGLLLSREEVEKAGDDAARNCRNVLETIPARLASQLTAAQLEAVKTEIRRALEELARHVPAPPA